MVNALADELTRVVEEAVADLQNVGEEVAAAKRSPQVWSLKEILGHLIDSAANNHQRFVRAQLGSGLVFPGYEQDAWVRTQDPQSRAWLDLIQFWALYNRHLAHTIRRIPDNVLNVPCRIGTGDSVTLGFLVQDYLAHLRHHLKQIDERKRA
jgi:hypothetical protein